MMPASLVSADTQHVQNASLIHDLLTWLAKESRPYEEVMTVWRTSCPRLTIWEDASDYGFVERFHDGGQTMVRPSAKGKEFLDRH